MENICIILSFLILMFCTNIFVNGWENERLVGFQSKRKQGEAELEALLSEGEEKCVNKPCVQSEQCCPGSVCVDVEFSGENRVAGTCLPIYGVNEGESCHDDNDCEPGLRCLENQPAPLALRQKLRTCQPPGRDMMKKQYNDECSTSSECDASHGLCCQIIKRHRMAPRRLCYYFSDPKSCIGSVDVTFAKPSPVINSGNSNAFFKARIG
jgi:hypothetical protein